MFCSSVVDDDAAAGSFLDAISARCSAISPPRPPPSLEVSSGGSAKVCVKKEICALRAGLPPTGVRPPAPNVVALPMDDMLLLGEITTPS